MKNKLEKEKTELLKKQCATSQRLIEIQTELDKPVILEPMGGKFFVSNYGSAERGIGINLSVEKYAAYCQTMEQAEELARLRYAQNRTYNFAIQHDGYRPFVYGEKNYFVYFNASVEGYRSMYGTTTYSPEKVYMTENCCNLFLDQVSKGLIKMEWEG